MTPEERKRLYLESSRAIRDALDELEWPATARREQLPPDGAWRFWLLQTGRGWGKTRTGSEFVSGEARAGRARRIALIERTPKDARETMIDGDSGLLHVGPPGNRPRWEAQRGRLIWPNGSIARVFTAAEPNDVRGFQSDLVWGEEVAAWKAPETFDQALFGLRLGLARGIFTTTPKRSPLLRRIRTMPGVAITTGHTLENAANLSPAIRELSDQIGGTRLGRQELGGELLEDADGALWQREWIDRGRRAVAPELVRVVVAVDPAVTSTDGSDETGIVGFGKGADGRGYVLRDGSGRFSPERWARRALDMLEELDGDLIVAEGNNGGDLVAHTIRILEPRVRVKIVRASRGKERRAEPCAAAYEHGDVSHVGTMPELEDQLCSWEPGITRGWSPDRLDALVWAWSELFPSRAGFSASDAIRAMGAN